MNAPALDDVLAARDRVDGIARVTPVLSSTTLGGLTGGQVSLEAENLQLTA